MKTKNAFLRCLKLLLLLATPTPAFPDIGDIKIEVSTSLSTTEIIFDVKIGNGGTIELTNLSFDLSFQNNIHINDSFQRLESGYTYQKEYRRPKPELLPGHYQFPLILLYSLDSGIQKQVVTLNNLFTAETPPSGVTISTPELIAYGNVETSFPLFIRNTDNYEKIVDIRLFSPSIVENRESKTITLSPSSRKYPEFRIKLENTDRPIQSELLFLLSFANEGFHYSQTIKSKISILPTPSVIERLFRNQLSITIIALGLLFVIILLALPKYKKQV